MKIMTKPVTLLQIQTRFREKVMSLGTNILVCPVCKQRGRVYKWSMYKTASRALMMYYQLGAEHKPVHSRELREHGHKGQGDETRLHNWGLLERVHGENDRSGFWKLTPLGRDYLLGKAEIPQWIWVFGKQVVAESDAVVGIHDVVDRFDYDAMMRNEF